MLEKNLTWADIDNLSEDIYNKAKVKKYDWIISINRGGVIPGVILSEMLDAKHGVISVINYDKKTKSKLAKLSSDLYISQIGYIKPHHNVLIVDNVIRSGESMAAAIKAAKKVDSDIQKVDTACFHLAAGSDFSPTYAAANITEKQWIKYPWEKHEQSRETK